MEDLDVSVVDLIVTVATGTHLRKYEKDALECNLFGE
jgi:hypothetical protein